MFNTRYPQFLSLYTKVKMSRQESIHGILYLGKIHLAMPDKMSSYHWHENSVLIKNVQPT